MKNKDKIIGFIKETKAFLVALIFFFLSVMAFFSQIENGECKGNCLLDKSNYLLNESINLIDSGATLYKEGREIFLETGASL